MSRAKKRPAAKVFKFDVRRRREIEQIARDVDAGDTDDLPIYLETWAAHNRDSKKPIEAVMMTADRLGRCISTANATEIVGTVRHIPERLTADQVAKMLGVNYEQRQRLGLTTIGAIDVNKEQRKERRKRRDREAKERKRRERGAKPRAEYEAKSLCKAKPWLAEGISRKTWYKRRATQRGR
jgi:hypothetical protein